MDEKWMRMALAQAQRGGELNEVPVGAVVVKDDRVVGVGFNQPIREMDPTAHAEVVAMRDAAKTLGNYRLTGCELYVTLEPCGMCVGAIVHARISKVVFGSHEPKSGACFSHQRGFEHTWLNHKVEVYGDVLPEEAGLLMSDFFARRRRESSDARKALKAG
mgnify:CR=1 FL=1